MVIIEMVKTYKITTNGNLLPLASFDENFC